MQTKIFGACALAALALAACGQQNAGPSAASQPLAPPSPAETAPAPVASALPPAPPAPVRYAPLGQRYTPLDDAYAMSQTYADAPPDYAFDYDGDAPEAWGSRDGVVRVGERVPGGWRDYYYQPGSDTPYLVRDPDYAYGFDEGQLVVIYDSRGRALPPQWADRQAGLAGRYLARGRDLWRAARERRRMEIEAQVWREQQADQERQRRYWAETRDADPDWRAYHDQHETAARDRWAQVAAAWAAAQVAGPQPAPPQGWERRRDGGVDEARQVWRARMAQQGPGPAQGWSGPPPQDQGQVQPSQDRWNRPAQGQWNGQQPQGRPGGQGWAGKPSDHQAQQQAEADRQFQAQPQAQAEHQHAAPVQPQTQAEHQHAALVQPQVQAGHQHAAQAQPQTQAEHQHAAQAPPQTQAAQVQPQVQAGHQHAAQVQPQVQAGHQHAAQVQPQAQTTHNGKPQEHAPAPGKTPQ
jgi:hypothetical protein